MLFKTFTLQPNNVSELSGKFRLEQEDKVWIDLKRAVEKMGIVHFD